MTILRDVIAVCGAAAVLFGLYQAWPPAAWILGGAGTLAAVICSRLSELKRNRDHRP